jgi:hypothetical protein
MAGARVLDKNEIISAHEGIARRPAPFVVIFIDVPVPGGTPIPCTSHGLISHYEIEYHILKIGCSTGRIDTLYSRDSLFATKRP